MVETLMLRTVELWNGKGPITLKKDQVYPLPNDIYLYLAKYGMALKYKSYQTREGA